MPVVGALIKRAFKLRNKVKFKQLEPQEYQEKTLKRLLKKAAKTEFGKHYEFKKILKSDNLITNFQRTIPIFDYDKIHEEWWHRTLNQETNICWPGKIKLFALSSGTTGAPSKHIPVTKDMLRSMRRAGLRMFMSLTDFDEGNTSLYEKGMMMLGGSTNLQDKGGIAMGDLSGINASRLPFWLRRFYKPGSNISSLEDWNERLEKIAIEAPNWDIGFIMGIPAWVQLMIEKILATHNANNIHEIWPNLEVYVSGGVAFEPYRKGFQNLLDRPIKILDTYLASEGFIAIQSSPDGDMNLLLDNNIFLEFIPFNDSNFDESGLIHPNPKVLSINEVQENEEYALVITTCAGAWRYMIGDTLKFTNLDKHEIIITGRTKHFLSICGEHLSVDNMNNAIQLVEEELNVNIREFTVSGIEYDGFFAHKWYIGCEPLVDDQILSLTLDEKLKALNDDYATERTSVLKGCFVNSIPPDLFYKWQEKQGKLGGQSKFPRVMKSQQFDEWVNFVEQCVTH